MVGKLGRAVATLGGYTVSALVYFGIAGFIASATTGLLQIFSTLVLTLVVGTVFLLMASGVDKGLAEDFALSVGLSHIMISVFDFITVMAIGGMEKVGIGLSLVVLFAAFIIGLIITGSVAESIEGFEGPGRF